MAKLILTNINDLLLEKLKLKASLNGHSVEEELNSILRSALCRRTEKESLQQIIASMSNYK